MSVKKLKFENVSFSVPSNNRKGIFVFVVNVDAKCYIVRKR